MKGIKSSNLGYPRIGEQREWKKALEAFWAGKLEESEFLREMENIRLSHLQRQKDKGIDWIPVGDFTLYDHMLDMSVMFGLVPDRFRYEGGAVPLSTYFSMARGSQTAVACEMTKWFNNNYHYTVPEFDRTKPSLTENKPLNAYREAKEKLGIIGKPVMIGLYTFIKLSKGYRRSQLPETMDALVPLYAQILQQLEQEGVEWVQIDEPILATSITKEEMELAARIYKHLHEAAPNLRIMLQTYFDSAEWFAELIQWPVQGIGLDFVHGLKGNLQNLETFGFPSDKVLGIGLVDGRNIWRSNLSEKRNLVRTIMNFVPPEHIWLQPSCSLLHVPVTVNHETNLEPTLKNALAFADEKLNEIVTLVRGFRLGENAIANELVQSQAAIKRLAHSPARNRIEIHQAVDRIQESDAKRNLPFEKRRKRQQERFNLPLLPTTTIGSFPQTPEVRRARKKWRKGAWTTERYDAFIMGQIKEWITIQEEIGLDVLVHGEFERSDMVEFFGEKLGGFAFTQNGWIQSYGSRCVRPPIIYGDVEFLEPMTVKETVFAQSQTEKPVKGMITGPVTILNWSFARDDLPKEKIAFQLALALRKEVETLESSGIHMIQVDEPALREGLPLKQSARQEYLDWAVKAFRLTTSSVKDTTQIHTHMCYCEFHDFIDTIRRMDADVISMETSRSHGELVSSFIDDSYDKGIGLGVYDVHSPRIPSVDEIAHIIRRGLEVLDSIQFWINPDCGLKTRGVEETIASLKNMVLAARNVRQHLNHVTLRRKGV